MIFYFTNHRKKIKETPFFNPMKLLKMKNWSFSPWGGWRVGGLLGKFPPWYSSIQVSLSLNPAPWENLSSMRGKGKPYLAALPQNMGGGKNPKPFMKQKCRSSIRIQKLDRQNIQTIIAMICKKQQFTLRLAGPPCNKLQRKHTKTWFQHQKQNWLDFVASSSLNHGDILLSTFQSPFPAMTTNQWC